MKNYTLYQIMATVCVAIFIVSSAMVILCMSDNHVYEARYRSWHKAENTEITSFEAQVNFNGLSEDFRNFFSNDCSLRSYELSDVNRAAINRLKGYYRAAWIFSVLSFAGGCYCFFILKRPRYYRPFIYGSALAALLTSFNALRLMSSGKPFLKDIRGMILENDYKAYFTGEDRLTELLPPGLAGGFAASYLMYAGGMAAAFIIIYFSIKKAGGPHKY